MRLKQWGGALEFGRPRVASRGAVHYFKSKSFGAPFSICGTESAPWGTLKLKVVFSGFAV